MEKPQYIDWIVEETGIVIKDDIPLKCYKIDYKDDESILDDWALHILNMLKAHSEEIFSCLDSYPEYFKDRLSVLMK